MMTVSPWGQFVPPSGQPQPPPPGPTRGAIVAGVLVLVALGVSWQAAGPGVSFGFLSSTSPGGAPAVPIVPFADAVAERVAIPVGAAEEGQRRVRTELVDIEVGRLRRFLIMEDTAGAIDHLLAATVRMGGGPERGLLLERATEVVAGVSDLPAESVSAIEDVLARLAADADGD